MSVPSSSSSSSSSSPSPATSFTPPLLRLLSDASSSTLIKQGAEAKVYKCHLCPRAPTMTLPSASTEATTSSSSSSSSLVALPPILVKYRFPKTYRHPSLTASLTASRTVAEVRALVRCTRGGVNVPRVRMVDEKVGIVAMEWIDGKSVRELLGGGDEGDEVAQIDDANAKTTGQGEPDGHDTEAGEEKEEEVWSDEEQISLMSLIARQLALMHAADVIHGDLTTSNMMVRGSATMSRSASRQAPVTTLATQSSWSTSAFLSQKEVLLIDFGLSHTSPAAEDKAVDLYVLQRAFTSTHPHSTHLFQRILDVYAEEVGRIWREGGWGMGGGLSTADTSGGMGKQQQKKKKGGGINGVAPPVGSRSRENPWKEISKKLDDARLRGRKRSMVG